MGVSISTHFLDTDGVLKYVESIFTHLIKLLRKPNVTSQSLKKQLSYYLCVIEIQIKIIGIFQERAERNQHLLLPHLSN